MFKGNERLLILYEKGKSVNREIFVKLASITNLNKHKLITDPAIDALSTHFDELPTELLFDIYQMNVFEIKQCSLRTLFDVLKHNLSQIETLEDGDIIKFERGLYSHHGLLTGN